MHKLYLKQQIEVCWILLTKQTYLGKFTVAQPFFAQALGRKVRILCQAVVFCTFLTKDATHTVLKINGKFKEDCTFLT